MSSVEQQLIDHIRHWLVTPAAGYLGNAYGNQIKSYLMQPMTTFAADAIVRKMKEDLPALRALDNNSVALYWQDEGDDTKLLTISVFDNPISILLNRQDLITESNSNISYIAPLAESFTVNGIEKNLVEIVNTLFEDKLSEKFADINVHGMPWLGSELLVERNVKLDGIANFNSTLLEKDAGRYLLMSSRHRNQKRGIYFLNTFIKCTWRREFEISQLYQDKTVPYPTGLYSEYEADVTNGDYYLTSRLRVDFFMDGSTIPGTLPEIRNAMRGVLPARLFIAQFRLGLRATTPIRIVDVATSVTRLSGKGKLQGLTYIGDKVMRMANAAQMATVLSGSGTLN